MNAQTRLALKVGFAAALSILLALSFHFQDPYWTGISAFLVCVDSADNSFQRMLQRVGCTLLGALGGLLAAHYLMDNPVLLILVAFVVMLLCVYKGLQSHNWYVWIFSVITFFMVIADVMTNASTQNILDVGVYRCLNIILGSTVGFAVAWTFSSAPRKVKGPRKRCYKLKVTDHWKRFRQNRFYAWFGVKVALAMVAFPLLWAQFNLPGATQIAVSIGAVLNIDFIATRQKSQMRVLGCFLGAIAAVFTLLVLRVETLSFLLVLVFAVAFACSYFHNSSSPFAYAGTQAVVAFLMGVVVSFEPSTIPDPSIERLVDIIGGVLLLNLVLQYLWPFSPQAQLKHFHGQVEQRLADIKSIAQGCLQHPQYDLFESAAPNLQLLKRDTAQLQKLKGTLPDTIPPLGALESALKTSPEQTLLLFKRQN